VPIPIDVLYQPSARDIASAQWGVISQRLSALDNSTSVGSPVFTPTADQVAYLTTVMVQGIPGAAIIPVALGVFVLDPAGNPIGDVFRESVTGGRGVVEGGQALRDDAPLRASDVSSARLVEDINRDRH